ncbi:MAG TPA: hypothetical protein DET40_24840 [Lentisphaeria bacterium]|nr:MAG: hypothetical protein A2X45_01165 [Lentisphaerae bacterium GWF2_50_93]HCE46788.1 hypothetical protein [Lentisphaeria bacterium]
MTELIKSMYGRPLDEHAFFHGTPVPGWHIEDEEGKIVSMDELSEGDIAGAYGNEFRDQAGMHQNSAPAESACAKIGRRWHEISGVDPEGRAITNELHGTDALYLEAASQIEAMSAILLVMNDGTFGNKKPREDILRKFSESLEMFVITVEEMKK